MVLRVRPDETLACRRVLHHPVLVPDQLADIAAIVKDAITALFIAVNGRGIPRRPARRSDTVSVQVFGNGPRRAACDVFAEDPQDDRGLLLNYDPPAFVDRIVPIAVRLSTSREAVANATRHAAPHLVDIVLSIDLAHHPVHGRLHRVDGTLSDGIERDVAERRLFLQIGKVSKIAGHAIKGFRQNNVERSVRHAGDHVLHANASMYRRPRFGLVVKRTDDLPTLLLSKRSAQFDLIIYRPLTL
ncbi:hypothetical protein V3589_11435 [Sinorhizobium fredii]